MGKILGRKVAASMLISRRLSKDPRAKYKEIESSF